MSGSSGNMSASSSGSIPASSSEQMPGENCECSSLSEAISRDDLQDILNQQQVTAAAWIEAFKTPLQKACTCSPLDIVKKKLLLEVARLGQTKDRYWQSLELDIAASNGNLDVIKKLCENNPDVFHIVNSSVLYGLAIPVVRASNAGHGEVTRYLHKRTLSKVLQDDGGYWANCLLLDAIFYGFLDIALAIFHQIPSLPVTKHPLLRSSPLRFLALKPDLFRSNCDLGFWQRLVYSCISCKNLDFPTDSETSKPNLYQRLVWMTPKCLSKWFGIMQIYELKDKHSKAQKLLQKFCGAIEEVSQREAVHEALFEAVENGNKEVFIEIIKCKPELLWISEAVSGRNLFHLAVQFRKEKIFNLIYGLDDQKVMLLRSYDKKQNNILHITAHLSRPNHLSMISGSALKMQREVQWFDEVGSLVSEREVVQKNNENMTPRQVFEESHESLRKEGEEWMKYTATACSFVAALIATVTFQAIFTVPGGYDGTHGKPLLLEDLHFTAFIISDTLAFFASCTSVLIFLSILTARYSFDDFAVSLPRKMILGLAILSFSILSMLVGFITALSSSMRQRPKLVVPMKPLAALPGILFLMLQYPLLKEMISSTYCKGVFHRHTKRWLLPLKDTQPDHVASLHEGSHSQHSNQSQ